MGYTPSQSEETHVLAQIELTGLTLYYADSNLSMSDGQYYDGRLSVSPLQRAFSSFTEPVQRQSTLTLTLIDTDGAVRALLGSYSWGNKTVKVLVGQGRDIGDYIEDFRGVIEIPGGISYDVEKVTIRLRDARSRDVATLPVNHYWTSDYANLESGKAGTTIPIVYGDWSDTPIPATCIDTTTNQFKLADHAIKEIVQIYMNGSAISHSDENLTDATFKIASYTPGTDEVTAKIRGRVDGSTNLIEHPVDILYDLQTEYIGIDSGDIDTSSYDDLETEHSGEKARRYIDSDTLTDTLIQELCIELDMDLVIDDGKYTLKSRIPSLIVDNEYDDTNADEDSFAVDYDPEGLYANEIKAFFDYDPVSGEYRDYEMVENAAEQTAVGVKVTRPMYFKWLYDDDDVAASAAHKLLLYSTEVKVITFEAMGAAVLQQLADRVGLTLANVTDRPLLVREISKDMTTRTTRISGYDALSFTLPGFWTGDAAPNYADATAEERASQGFWTNDDGEAEPGNAASKISTWW
jgi:hypothetical protein